MEEHTDYLESQYTGFLATQPFVGHMAHSRLAMLAQQLSQCLVTSKSDQKIIQTGTESQLGTLTFSIKAPCDLEIMEVIRKDKGDKIWITKYIYEDIATGGIGLIEVPLYFSIDARFGWKYKLSEKGKNLRRGSRLLKGDIIADSPTKGNNGAYNFGMNLNLCLSSDVAGAEDSVIISDKALEKINYDTVETLEIEIHENQVPCFIYPGDKTMPEVGDKIRSDNIIMCLREVDLYTVATRCSVTSLRNINYITDKVYQVHGCHEGEIIDISIIRNNQRHVMMGEPFDQLNRLADLDANFHRSVVTAYRRCRQNKPKDIEISENLHTEIVGSVHKYGDSNSIKRNAAKLTKKRSKLQTFTIVFTIKKTQTPTHGSKFSDLTASKGVIGKIKPAEEMPVDLNGVRADIIMSPESIIGRNVVARLYEQYFANVSYITSKKVSELFGINRDTAGRNKARRIIKRHYKDNSQEIKECIRLLTSLYNIVNPVHAKLFTAAIQQERIFVDHIVDIVLKHVTFVLNVDILAKRKAPSIIKELKESEHNPVISKLSITSDGYKYGESIGKVTSLTKDDIVIAYGYFILLEKDGSSMSSTASVRLQAMGLTAASSKIDKDLTPISKTNVKVLGIDETGIMVSAVDPKGVAEFVDMQNNPDTHAHVCKQILASDTPTGMENIVDREIMPYTGGRALSIIRHMFSCYGVEIFYKDTEEK